MCSFEVAEHLLKERRITQAIIIKVLTSIICLIISNEINSYNNDLYAITDKKVSNLITSAVDIEYQNFDIEEVGLYLAMNLN